MERTLITIEAAGNIYGGSTWSAVRALLGERAPTSVRCAISYVMQSGSGIVRAELQQLLTSGIEMTVVFGDDFRLSESKALRVLMDLGCQLRLHSRVSSKDMASRLLPWHARGCRWIV
jgi:hypothetical protein